MSSSVPAAAVVAGKIVPPSLFISAEAVKYPCGRTLVALIVSKVDSTDDCRCVFRDCANLPCLSCCCVPTFDTGGELKRRSAASRPVEASLSFLRHTLP